MSDECLMVYAVYYKPKDYPNGYIARRYEIRPNEARPSEDAFHSNSLEGIREQMPEGLFCLARTPNDHPSVVEVWL